MAESMDSSGKAVWFQSCRVAALHPHPPFAFDATVTKPSHFATPTERHAPGEYWHTMRFGDRVLGVHMRNAGTVAQPRIEVSVFSETPLTDSFLKEIAAELTWRFDLQADSRPSTTSSKATRSLAQ